MSDDTKQYELRQRSVTHVRGNRHLGESWSTRYGDWKVVAKFMTCADAFDARDALQKGIRHFEYGVFDPDGERIHAS